MAKKVVVPESEVDEKNKPKKKKRSKCCTCCIVILIIIVIILAAAFGVGWYFGDMLTREYFDMSLGEVFGVLGDMYWANDEKVVERPFDADDLDGFYKEIKRNIMLKEDADVDFDGALSRAVTSILSQTNESVGAVAVKKSAALDYEYFAESYSDHDGHDDGNYDNGETGGESSSQIMDILTGMVVNALSRDNIDLDRLNAYDEHDPETDTYKFNLNDRQLAAFIDSVLQVVFENADKIDDFKEYSQIVDLPKSVALKQVVFSTVGSGDEIKATMAKVTVWIGLESAAGQAATHFIEDAGMGWVAPLARGMCNVILPENLYVSISIPLYGDADPFININDMDDAERARAYKLVNKIMDGGDGDALTEMLSSFTDGLKPMLQSAAEHMDFENANSGTVTVDLLDTAIKMATEGMEGEQLTKADFLYVLKALMSDPDAQLDKLEPYMFRNRYLIDDKEVYIKGGDSSKTPIDYETKFIDEIKDKYSLKFGENTKLDDVLAMLGVSLDGSNNSEMGSQDLLGLIDAQKFNQSLDRPLQDLKLKVTDRMLGAAMSGQMNKVLTSDGLADMDLKLDALSFVKKKGKPQNLYANLAVEANMSGLFDSFGDDSMIAQLAVGLMPSKLLFTITVDITRDRPAGQQKDKVEFILNSCENTDRALDTLEKLVPSLDLNSISEQIETMFNDMLDQMYKTLDIQLVASTYEKTGSEWTGDPGALEMPDIFTVVTDMVLVDDDGERVVSPEQLKNVLRGINDTSGVDLGDGIASSYKGFIDQVVDKYYFAPDNDDKMETLGDLTQFMSAFDTGKFRVYGEDPDVYYIAYDNREVSELKPTMSGAELGALIKEQMGEDVADYTVENVGTGNDRLTVVLSIEVGSLLPEDVNFLLTTDKLYVTVGIDVSVVEGDGSEDDPFRYGVSIKLNSMNKTDYASTLKIVQFFRSDFDIASKVNEFGRIMYDQMRSINDSFAADDGSSSGSDDFFVFTGEGLVMTDFYSFLASKMNVTFDEGTTVDDVKAAVQGMYARSSVPELYNANNYVESNIVYNRGSRDWNGGPFPTDDYSDRAFNGYLVKYVEDSLGKMTMEQTVSLATTNGSDDAVAARAWLSARLGTPLDDNTDYLAVTVSMDMRNYMDSGDKSQSFFPKNQVVHGTIVYKFENGEFTSVGTVFNEMDASGFNVLQQIMQLSSQENEDPTKITINKITAKTALVLNGITEVCDITLDDRINNEGVGSLSAEQKIGYGL